MKLAFNTWVYEYYPLEEAIKRIAETGYDGVELDTNRPHAYPRDLRKDEREDIVRLLNSYNVEVPAICPFDIPHYNFASPKEKIRNETVQYVCDCIQLASDIGCKIVLCCPGRVIFRTSYRQAWKWALEGLKECAEFADKKDITLALEPLGRNYTNIGNTVDEILWQMNNIPFENVGIVIDTAQSTFERESLVDCVKKVGKKLVHVHIRDLSEAGADLPPGKGAINFEVFLNALKDIGYDGYLTVELFKAIEPDAIALESKAFLDTILRK